MQCNCNDTNPPLILAGKRCDLHFSDSSFKAKFDPVVVVKDWYSVWSGRCANLTPLVAFSDFTTRKTVYK